MENKKNIAITGTGSLVGQAVIKSIVRSDLKDKINLIGFDYFKDTVGSFWVSQNFILPDILKPHVTHQDWLNSLLSALLANDIKMLFVGVDFELPLFAKFKDEIEQKTGAIVMVSSLDVISIADDKFLTFEFLKKHGLPCPESFLPDNIDNNKLKFPIIIKPRKGARSVGVHKIKDQTHLLSVMKTIDDPIIQEYVGTDDEEYTCEQFF